MRRGLLYGVAFLVAVACQSGDVFVCNGDDDCDSASGGVCQPTGACSFPDDTCDSGQRYGDNSPASIAGECVATGGTTGGQTSTGADDDSTGSSACPDDWWDCAWAHRHRVALTRTINPPLSNVPVLVQVSQGRVDHGLMQNDGEDVRFVSAGGELLSHEVERWDPSGVSTFWVNIEELGGSSSYLWIYYGNPVAERAEDPAGVWPEPYVGVWHLEDDPTDSTGFQHDGSVGEGSEAVPGHVANGRRFIDTDARVDVEPTPDLAEVFATGGTLSAWIRPTGWGPASNGGYGRIAQKATDEAGWTSYVTDEGAVRFSHEFGLDNGRLWGTVPEVIALHQWSHVVITYDLNSPLPPDMFINGVQVALGVVAEPPGDLEAPSDLEVPLLLGNRSNNDRRFAGIIDEVRIETDARDIEWIEVQHQSMRDDLLSYGPIESLGGAP